MSILVLGFYFSWAQTDKQPLEKKIYSSVGGEFIFSFANTNQTIETTNLRFSAWYHVQWHWHFDFNNNIGTFWGLGSRNVGYASIPENNNNFVKGFTSYNATTEQFEINDPIYKDKQMSDIIRRVYTIGVPLGLKLGLFDKSLFLFFGAEVELPFHYKNKVWIDDEKIYKSSEWFSKQVNPVLYSSFVGVQLPWGINIKFKWYWNDLMNPNYDYYSVKPYAYQNSQMYYFSFGMNMFNAKRALKTIQHVETTDDNSYSM
ncbi:MAG: hypothetical protein JXR60_10970 [Bacteroidales bacterium]|nr:hypothetical protein [Bacteroidales bacterium]